MKVLMLNNEYPPLGGGAGVISRYIAEGLVDLGHKVTVVTTWFEGEKEVEERGGLTIIKVKSYRKTIFKSGPVEFLAWMQATKKFLKQYCTTHAFDLSVGNYLLPSGEVCRYLKSQFGIPYAVISHGHDVPFAFPRQMLKFHLLTYLWLKRILSKASVFLVQSSEMKLRSDKFIGTKRAHSNIIIPNGCNAEVFVPDYSKKKEVFTIILVGRLVAQKDPMTFLKAVKILDEKKVPFHANILGDGPLKNKIEKFVIDNNLQAKVKLKGWVPKSEMIEEYQSASIQVITSLFEGMSIAALEALSCGLYLMTTPVSGNPDVVEEGVNGEFIPYRNAEVLADKLEQYYSLKFRKGYLVPESFLTAFKQTYNWENIVKKYESVLKEIVA